MLGPIRPYRRTLVALGTVLLLACGSEPQDAGEATEAVHEVRAEEIQAEIDAGEGQEWHLGHAAADSFERVSIADLNGAPAEYADRKVVVSGTVTRVCQARGCWVEVTDAEGASMMAASFDDGVLLPKNCAEMAIEIVGTMYADPVEEGEEQTYTLSLDGAHLERRDDG